MKVVSQLTRVDNSSSALLNFISCFLSFKVSSLTRHLDKNSAFPSLLTLNKSSALSFFAVISNDSIEWHLAHLLFIKICFPSASLSYENENAKANRATIAEMNTI